MSICNTRQRFIHIDKGQLVSWFYTAESGTEKKKKKKVVLSPWLQKILKAGGSWSKIRVFSAPVQTGPGAHPASYKIGIGSLSRGQSGRGVALTTHTHLASRLKKGYSYTSTPVWSFVACSRMNFTFTYAYHTARRHIPENSYLHSDSHQNHKSYLF